MKKTYSAPTAEVVDAKTDEIMQGFQIPVSGGTTPEESDAKPGLADDEPSEHSIWDD
ncbi:hypothetical protein [Prevotella sp. KH2C16]|uniref:hypothetical protein n=1 Tax=Prevotella sp. KH2C16 TaxID=1855325 RepID=UPI0008E3EAF6|nr:hypothetical protein [Prevotella sp. KH2C16]SFG63610.1 hypothetical protein SAMN05216383_12431 [Prevotella sp. KH2C16]